MNNGKVCLTVIVTRLALQKDSSHILIYLRVLADCTITAPIRKGLSSSQSSFFGFCFVLSILVKSYTGEARDMERKVDFK